MTVAFIVSSKEPVSFITSVYSVHIKNIVIKNLFKNVFPEVSLGRRYKDKEGNNV